MDRKIIPFPHRPLAAATPAQTPDAALERTLFLADAEHAWTTTSVPQAEAHAARAVY